MWQLFCWFSRFFRLIFGLPALQHLDCRNRAERERHTYSQTDDGILYEAGDDEGYKRDGGNRKHVGCLRRYMVDMVALRAGRGHDRRIGDGRAVVTHDGAGQAGGDADDQELVAALEHKTGFGIDEYLRDDRDQDAEGAPACAGREGEEAGDDEDNGRKHLHQSGGSALHHRVYILVSTEKTGHGLERDGKGQN